MEKKSSYQGKTTLTIVTIGNTTNEVLDINGLTVLELLKKTHDIEIIQTGPGKMVKCIDGVCAKGVFWWQFHVNGELAPSSVDRYYPKESEIILLKYGDEG